MNRRQFGQVAAGAMVGAAALQRARAQSTPPGPAKFTSVNGVLEATLEPGFITRTFAGREYKLVAYNGRIPGPVLEARPGDTVRVHLNNTLDHPTNLHFHGLHVSPSGNADNSFVLVRSSESFLYEFKIPQNHPPGLYWYHPHVHALSNIQVRSGMAGLLSIRGDFDLSQDIPDAVEYDMVIQNLRYFVYNPPHTEHLGDVHAHHPEPDDRPPTILLVNGQLPQRGANGLVTPTIKVKTHGLLRVRILNVGPGRTTRLALVNAVAGGGGGVGDGEARELAHLQHLIAADGSPLEWPAIASEVLMAPGSRVELMLETNISNGQFSLYDMPYYQGVGTPGAAAALATFQYDGVMPRGLFLPQRLNFEEPLPRPSGPVRRFEFSVGRVDGVYRFLINGKLFDLNRVDVRVKLGDIEDWEISNTHLEDHSFHIHTNPFQVLDAYGNPEPAWRDTVNLPRGVPVTIRTRFTDFTGKSLFHCHALGHEDNSMMQVVEIVE